MPRSHSKPVKPHDPHVLRLHVVRSERISPSFVRVTLGGDDLARFTPMGYDQWFRLFLPRDPRGEPPLPTSTNALWWPQVLRMPTHERPHVRNYTVSAARPDDGELDVDFVLHGTGDHPGTGGAAGSDGRAGAVGAATAANSGDAAVANADAAPAAKAAVDADADDHGVAAAWAAAVQPGWSIGLLDQGIGWNPPAPPRYSLIVGDETALPAVAGIARDLPRDALGTIVLEVPTDGDRRELDEPDGVDVIWLTRKADAIPGAAALATASSLPLPYPPDDGVYCYVSGEQSLAAGLRRALVARGVPKSQITFCGYWRR